VGAEQCRCRRRIERENNCGEAEDSVCFHGSLELRR